MPLLRPGQFRLFLATVVVLHHSTPVRLGAWAVGLFFCLSGFWIAEMWQRKYRHARRPYLGVVASVREWRPSKAGACASAAVTAAIIILAAWPVTRHWVWIRGASDTPLTGPLSATLTVATILSAVPLAIATTRVPSGPLDRALGDLSYPLYLFHWLPRCWYYGRMSPAAPLASTAGLLAVNVGAAFAGAAAILFCVDRPAQWLRTRWVGRRSLPEEPSPGPTPASVVVNS
jgi:peptidoglycan/LPS O-acetylase OafA/YrhL